MKQFVIKELHAGLESDSSNSSHPMNNKVFTPAEAQDGFDRIAYQKCKLLAWQVYFNHVNLIATMTILKITAGSVLRMLHNSFGDKVFVEAIQAYLKAKSYDVAHPEDLYKAMEERMSKETKKPGELKVDVTTVMKSWTEQAGYPVVQATRVKDQVTLSQVCEKNSMLKAKFSQIIIAKVYLTLFLFYFRQDSFHHPQANPKRTKLTGYQSLTHLRPHPTLKAWHQSSG